MVFNPCCRKKNTFRPGLSNSTGKGKVKLCSDSKKERMYVVSEGKEGKTKKASTLQRGRPR